MGAEVLQNTRLSTLLLQRFCICQFPSSKPQVLSLALKHAFRALCSKASDGSRDSRLTSVWQLQHADPQLRAGAADALRMCALRMQGCERILEAQALPVLLKTVSDPDTTVRSVTLQACAGSLGDCQMCNQHHHPTQNLGQAEASEDQKAVTLDHHPHDTAFSQGLEGSVGLLKDSVTNAKGLTILFIFLSLGDAARW